MQFAVGIVTLVAAFALAAIILWFGEFQFAFQPKITYYVTFPNAMGAEPGMPVRRAGIRIGEVRKVEYDPESSLVVLTLWLDANNELRAGDEPTIKPANLLGDYYVDIEVARDLRGKPDRSVIPPDSTMEGKTPIGIDAALTDASELVPNANDTMIGIQRATREWTDVGNRTRQLLATNEERIAQILEETRVSTERLAQTLESINNILDPKTQENLKTTVQNLNDASEQMVPVIESAKKAIDQITSTTSKLDEVATNMATATKPLAERGESTMKNIDESVASLNVILNDLREMLVNFRTGEGTIQKLVNDPSVYQNLDDAAFLLVRNLADLEQIMGNLKVFSDKIARHPGELGLQGVLTRDQGLKNVDPQTVQEHRKGIFKK